MLILLISKNKKSWDVIKDILERPRDEVKGTDSTEHQFYRDHLKGILNEMVQNWTITKDLKDLLLKVLC